MANSMKRLTLKGQLYLKKNQLFLSDSVFPLGEMLHNYIYWSYVYGEYWLFKMKPELDPSSEGRKFEGYLYNNNHIGSVNLLQELKNNVGKWVLIKMDLYAKDGYYGPWLT